MTKLSFCQNDLLMVESFWENNRLVNHILFELCLIMIFSPDANFGHHPLGIYLFQWCNIFSIVNKSCRIQKRGFRFKKLNLRQQPELFIAELYVYLCNNLLNGPLKVFFLLFKRRSKVRQSWQFITISHYYYILTQGVSKQNEKYQKILITKLFVDL